MARNTFLSVLIFTLMLLTGCATSSPIQRASTSASKFKEAPIVMEHSYQDKDVYRIYHQAATGFNSIASIRTEALQRAEAFARAQGKGVAILGEKISQPPYILGNFPRIEIVFAVVPISQSPIQSHSEDRYAQLERLKKLLDDGAITKEEYEKEKAKLLK
jgi:Short C-terminal domain